MAQTAAQARLIARDISELDDRLGIPLKRMMRDRPGFAYLNSGYRPDWYQAVLFADAVMKYGSEAKARKWVAPPGRSSHNHRFAADLGYRSDADKAWAHENCGRYGLRYPMSYEDWHIEPVSKTGPVAPDPNPDEEDDVPLTDADVEKVADKAAGKVVAALAALHEDHVLLLQGGPTHVGTRQLLDAIQALPPAVQTIVQDQVRVILRGQDSKGKPTGHPYNLLAIARKLGVSGLPK